MNTIQLKSKTTMMNDMMTKGERKMDGKIVITLIGLIVGLAIAPLQASFSDKDAGSRGAQFLKLPVGAKYIGMGEVGTALAKDANAIYYNVAGLASLGYKSAEYMYSGYSISNKSDGESNPGQHWIAFAMPISESIGSAGVGFQYYTAGDINKTDIKNASLGTFNPSDLAVNLSYARKVMEQSLGLNLKIISSKIENTATTVAVDLGYQAKPMMDEKLMLGAAFQNLGGSLKYETESAKLPIMIKLGSAYKVMDNWVTALDVVFPEDNSPNLGLGTDYVHQINEDVSVAGRLGYNSRTRKVGGFSGLSFGAGLNFRMALLDFAWTPMGDIGSTFKISAGVKF